MQFYIIRHCQSENNALWQRTGSSDGRLADPPLTEIGRLQAEQLAAYIAGANGNGAGQPDDPFDRAGIDITHLYCSLMGRSIETGLIIAKALDLPLIAREDIHERGGIYLTDPQTDERIGLAGPNRDDFSRSYPTLILPETLRSEGWWNRPYEDRETSVLRAHSFLDWLLETHAGTEDRVAIITHAGFIQSIFSALLGVPDLSTNLGSSRNIWIRISNGSITRLDFYEELVRLGYQNRVDFIPTELLT
jgi:2,3-bisphosphoglycerate-dependent phosphoglycerate mutase